MELDVTNSKSHNDMVFEDWCESIGEVYVSEGAANAGSCIISGDYGSSFPDVGAEFVHFRQDKSSITVEHRTKRPLHQDDEVHDRVIGGTVELSDREVSIDNSFRF